MPTNKNKLIQDISQLAGSAFGIANNARHDIEQKLKDIIESTLRKHNIVTREEFEIVKQMATNARIENEKLTQRIKELEEKL